jgi:hypothetical protein
MAKRCRNVADLDALVDEVVAQQDMPNARVMLQKKGVEDARDESVWPDKKMWARFNLEFGGIGYKTMRALVEECGIDPDYFVKRTLSYRQGEVLLQRLRQQDADDDDSAHTEAFEHAGGSGGGSGPSTPAKRRTTK